jgi:hypothetical protein
MPRRAKLAVVPAAAPIGDLVDELGILKVRMSADEAEEKRLRVAILERAVAAGNDALEGKRFRALVVNSLRKQFDIAKAKEVLGPKKVAVLTTDLPVQSLRVTPIAAALLDKAA